MSTRYRTESEAILALQQALKKLNLPAVIRRCGEGEPATLELETSSGEFVHVVTYDLGRGVFLVADGPDFQDAWDLAHALAHFED